MWSDIAKGTRSEMPSAVGKDNASPSKNRVGGGSISDSSSDDGPVLVKLPSQRAQDRQRALDQKRKREEEELAVKEQQLALEREAAEKKREEDSNGEANLVQETARTPTAAESGRRRGRKKKGDEDDEEKERANKQQGVGSPMRTATRSSREVPPESPLRVDDVDMSLDGPPSILRNRHSTSTQANEGGSGPGAATTSSKAGGSVNTTSSSRSRVRPMGSRT